MDKTAFDLRYREYQNAVEDFLQGQFSDKPHWEDLYASMRYSTWPEASGFVRYWRWSLPGWPGPGGRRLFRRPAPWRWCIPTL